MYLSIGMTYDQYWNDDPKLTKYYLEAYKIKQKRSNYEAWLQGLYIYEALCDVSPVLHAFAKKGTKPTKYPNEPYPIDETEHKEREQKKTNIRMEALRQRLIAMSNKKR